MRATALASLALAIAAATAAPTNAQVGFDRLRDTAKEPGNWLTYSGDYRSQRYSPLDQITPENVASLEVAWEYQTGEVRGEDDPGETTYEVTPLVFDDTMYICTPFATVIALDPVTGEERWRFDPQLQRAVPDRYLQ